MQVTQGKSSPFADADVLLDVMDASTGIFPFQVTSGYTDFRQPAVLVTRSSSPSIRSNTTAALNQSFYASVNNWIDATSVHLGADGLVRPLTKAADFNGGITAGWINWVIGVDPSASVPSPVGIVPFWQKLRWQSVVRSKTAIGSFFHGFVNGNSTNPFNSVSAGNLAIMLYRPPGDSFTGIIIRTLGTGAGSQTIIPLAAPVECVSRFLDIVWEVTLGPTFRLECSINDEVVFATDFLSLGIDLTPANSSQLVMQAAIMSQANGGFEGPWYSRGTILRVS